MGICAGLTVLGTGVFQDAAALVVTFAFDTIGIHRLEARAAVGNGRGNGALLKMGAVQECVLRQSFERDGVLLDQLLYAILEDEWRAMQNPRATRVILPVLVH